MTTRAARIRFNEVVRCARIVNLDSAAAVVQELDSMVLKMKPIVFRPRGSIIPNILGESKMSIFSMKSTSVSKPPPPTVANGWYVDLHMHLFYEYNRNVFKTTPIVTIDGNIVTTNSGSTYILGTMDPLVRKILANVDIPVKYPLAEETLPFVVNAAMDT